MVSVQRIHSSAEQSVDQTTKNPGTRPAGSNVSQATQHATENAHPGISPVETGAEGTQIATGSESVMGPVCTIATLVTEFVRTTPRAAAPATLRDSFVFLMISPGLRITSGSAEMTASTISLSAMEPVHRVTVLVGNIGVSAMKKRMTTLPAMITANIRMSTLIIITGYVGRNVSTGKTA